MGCEIFDEDYYLHGRKSGKSLYENYRWLPELTIPMALSIVEHLGIDLPESVCDFGCARGYIVKALRILGIEAFGVDISEWAIKHCDPEVKPYVSTHLKDIYDWIIAKDVLEHVPEKALPQLAGALMAATKKGLFVVVPLSRAPDEPYVCEEYEKDITHLVRWDIDTWVDLFKKQDRDEHFEIAASFNVPGIKQNYEHIPQCNGFLTLRRVD